MKARLISTITIISDFVTKNINANNPSNIPKIFKGFILITLIFYIDNCPLP